MERTGTATGPRRIGGWVRVAATRDAGTAERWRDALLDRDIEAEIRIEDALDATPGSSLLPGFLPPVPAFAQSLFVPAEDERRARAALIDAGWSGRVPDRGTHGSGIGSREVLFGALLALASAAAIIALRMLAA